MGTNNYQEYYNNYIFSLETCAVWTWEHNISPYPFNCVSDMQMQRRITLPPHDDAPPLG